MNARAEALADAALNGDRDYLVANPKGVPLDILPLDTDPTFHAAEVKRAVLKAENARRNADKIKELEDQLNLRAIELAEERRQKDLEGIDEKPNGVPLEVLDPHSDPQFAEMVEKRRELEKDPSQAAALAALVDSMNQRAQSLAKNMVESDRGYLDKDPEGVSLEVLPLDTDETFKKLESKRAVLKAQDPPKEQGGYQGFGNPVERPGTRIGPQSKEGRYGWSKQQAPRRSGGSSEAARGRPVCRLR
ncbi:hypothetical protein ADEAN_000302800 [Angomonas deanei]|uniref:DUF7623 domain-containing protein n=1 Tax=Angomonas deanei TaxID=59799 RepID=A0A7G2C9Y4_9TRYP|nr:hypothetical protein ADEAN_000302800 [Angomonas deanei]